MGSQTSPGVYPVEIDMGRYVSGISMSRFGVVGTASKGPTDTPTLITDEGQLVSTFGYPSTDHLGLFAAQRYLREGRQLVYVRVAAYGASAAEGTSTKVGGGTTVFTAAGSLTPNTGSWGNDLSVVIGTGTDASTHRVSVKYQGTTVESFDLIVVGSANAASTNFIDTRINGVSEFISVEDTGVGDALTAGTVTLTGGDDGVPVDNSDIIGAYNTPPTIPSTGLHCFDNKESIQIDFVATPGYTDAAVVQALITLAETRTDCVALIDPPYGLTVMQVVAWHNGTSALPEAPTAGLDSSYAALYWPWVQVYDSRSEAYVWIPPSGYAAQVFARTDAVAEVWWAPAGNNRGQLLDVIDVEHNATQGERDYMMGNGNMVNPLCKLHENAPYCIWGQQNLQRATTSRNRLTVRRMLIYLRRAIADASEAILMDPNDEITWSNFRTLVDPTFRKLVDARALSDYSVICDSSTNTVELQRNNTMLAKLLVVPVGTVEILRLQFINLPTGASISEIVV